MKMKILTILLFPLCAMPAHAELTPTQRMVISIEVWRERAEECRTIYSTFTSAEVTALTDFVANGRQFAKFGAEELNELTKAIKAVADKEPKPTRKVCEKLRGLIFGKS